MVEPQASTLPTTGSIPAIRSIFHKKKGRRFGAHYHSEIILPDLVWFPGLIRRSLR